MSPTGMDVILYEYFNKWEKDNFFSTTEKREALERVCRWIYAGEYSSPGQAYERARKALEIQL